jgi:hypothetical protein
MKIKWIIMKIFFLQKGFKETLYARKTFTKVIILNKTELESFSRVSKFVKTNKYNLKRKHWS